MTLSRRAFLKLGVAAAAVAACTVPAWAAIDVVRLIEEIATKYGIDPKAFLKMAKIESALNPKAFHPKSKAAGLFQFIPSTARAYGLKDPFDARANAEAAARLWIDNSRYFERKMGRAPTAGEVYLCHQQGPSGACKLLLNPTQPAHQIVGKRAVLLNGGSVSMTSAEFAALWTRKFADL